MTRRKLTRWVEADDLTKLAILDLAKELRVQGQSWYKIPPEVARVFGVQVSWQCLWFRLTPDGMKKKRENTRRYNLTHSEQVKQYAARYRLEHPEWVKAQAARYRLANREKMRQYAAKYRLEHPERVKAQAARYREKKKIKQEERK